MVADKKARNKRATKQVLFFQTAMENGKLLKVTLYVFRPRKKTITRGRKQTKAQCCGIKKGENN